MIDIISAIATICYENEREQQLEVYYEGLGGDWQG